MNYKDIFKGTTILLKAQRHLSNRKSYVRKGKLHCEGAEREAIDLMASIVNQLDKEMGFVHDKRKKGAA